MKLLSVMCVAAMLLTACGAQNSGTTGGSSISRQLKSDRARDAQISRQVRSWIAGESALSADAANLYVTTQNGVVTLRGVVGGELERTQLLAGARRISGVVNVMDEMVASAVSQEPLQQAGQTPLIQNKLMQPAHSAIQAEAYRSH